MQQTGLKNKVSKLQPSKVMVRETGVTVLSHPSFILWKKMSLLVSENKKVTWLSPCILHSLITMLESECHKTKQKARDGRTPYVESQGDAISVCSPQRWV
jgi:hypothetical protein